MSRSGRFWTDGGRERESRNPQKDKTQLSTGMAARSLALLRSACFSFFQFPSPSLSLSLSKLTVHAQPRTHPFVLTVLWIDLDGLGCKERTEWLAAARPASAADESAAAEAEEAVEPFFFQLSLLVVLETMPLTFSSE